MDSVQVVPTITIRDVAIACAGPVATGLCIGIAQGGSAMVECAAIVPAITLGVSGIMVPALYIGGAYLGPVPSANAFLAANLKALRDAGLVLLGLAAPLAFLVATTLHPYTSLAFGAAALALACLVGMRSLLAALRRADGMSSAAALLFGVWCICFLAIGATLFVEFIRRAS